MYLSLRLLGKLQPAFAQSFTRRAFAEPRRTAHLVRLFLSFTSFILYLHFAFPTLVSDYCFSLDPCSLY